MIDDLPPLKEVIRAFGLDARKSLGQHFLLDPGILSRIVRIAEPLQGKSVLEVGPGPGGLTRAILEADPKYLVAIERDARCVRALQSLVDASDARLQVIPGDALKWRIADLFGDHRSIKIIANLPYNISSPLLVGWLSQLDHIEAMVLMFQKEMARRLFALPHSKDYSRLSVITQVNCFVESSMELPRGAFLPPPKVNSTVLRLTPVPTRPSPETFMAVARIAAAAFNQRRKMLRRSLNGIDVNVQELCKRSGISSTERADSVSVEGYRKLGAEYVRLRREMS